MNSTIPFRYCLLFALACLVSTASATTQRDSTIEKNDRQNGDAPTSMVLKKGTPVTFRTTEKVSSHDGFEIKTIALEIYTDVSSDGKTIVFNQNNYGEAEVTAQKAGAFGKPGKVEITAVSVRTVNGQRVRLDGIVTEKRGKDQRGMALGLSIGIPIAGLAMSTPPGILLFGIIGLFIKGREAVVPSGTIVRAVVAEDVVVQL